MHIIGNVEFEGIIAVFSEQRQILNRVFPVKQELWFLLCSLLVLLPSFACSVNAGSQHTGQRCLPRSPHTPRDTGRTPVGQHQGENQQHHGDLNISHPSFTPFGHCPPIPKRLPFGQTSTKLAVRTQGERGSPGEESHLDWQKEAGVWAGPRRDGECCL